MKSWFEKLNLRPQERRLVVIVGLIFFIVFNIWFILPKFSEWSIVSNRMELELKNLQKFQDEIEKRQEYEGKLAELQSGGSEFLTNDLQLLRIVQNQYNGAKLQVSQTRVRPPLQGANKTQFYQELGLDLSHTSGVNELIDFLVGIADQSYMIRVRELNVRPDPSQSKLIGNLVLIAHLQTNLAAATPPKSFSNNKTNAPSAGSAGRSGMSTGSNNALPVRTSANEAGSPPPLGDSATIDAASRPPANRPRAAVSEAALPAPRNAP